MMLGNSIFYLLKGAIATGRDERILPGHNSGFRCLGLTHMVKPNN